MDYLQQLIDLFLHLDRHLQPIIEAYGPWTYLLLVVIVFCETGLVVTPILPGDSLLFAAGAFAATGSLSLTILLISLAAAAVVGDAVNYWVGYALGRRILAARRFRLIKPEHIAYTEEFFAKYGAKTIVIARFVPIVRTMAPFVAGVGRMGYRRFMSFNVFGGVAWVGICTTAGYLFGNLPLVKDNFSLVVLAIVALSVAPAVWELWRSRSSTRARAQAVPAGEPVDLMAE